MLFRICFHSFSLCFYFHFKAHFLGQKPTKNRRLGQAFPIQHVGPTKPTWICSASRLPYGSFPCIFHIMPSCFQLAFFQTGKSTHLPLSPALSHVLSPVPSPQKCRLFASSFHSHPTNSSLSHQLYPLANLEPSTDDTSALGALIPQPVIHPSTPLMAPVGWVPISNDRKTLHQSPSSTYCQ